MLSKIELIIFDLDGVLVNSKANMALSWKHVRKKFKIKKKFSEYSKFIGFPFVDILRKLSINKKQKEIQSYYYKISKKNLNKIRAYNNVRKVLDYFKKKNMNMAIVTSKNKDRTMKLIKRMKFPIKNIVCPGDSYKGKPYPDQINIALKRCKTNKKKIVYVGDMKVDYLLSKNAKINFIYAKYGYSKNQNFKFKHSIRKFEDLKTLIYIKN